jgi:hypothetical protein
MADDFVFLVHVDDTPLDDDRVPADYPFADRLFPHAPEVLGRLRRSGRTVILTGGDVVFQSRKVERSGLAGAVDRQVLVYIDEERMLGDEPRILRGEGRVGRAGDDGALPAGAPRARRRGGRVRPPDLAVERIGDLLGLDLPVFVSAARRR